MLTNSSLYLYYKPIKQKNMKTFISILLLSLLTACCTPPPQTNEPPEAKLALKYFKDAQTGLCFAFASDHLSNSDLDTTLRNSWDLYQTGMCIPCDSLRNVNLQLINQNIPKRPASFIPEKKLTNEELQEYIAQGNADLREQLNQITFELQRQAIILKSKNKADSLIAAIMNRNVNRAR